MFAFTLKTLVLRGVVRKGELGVLRLFGVEAPRLPGNANPVLPPARTGPDTDQAMPDVVGYPTKGVSPRAGRSCRHNCSSVNQGIVTGAASTWRRLGGTARSAAAIVQALMAGVVASVGEVSPRLAIPALGTQEGSR